MENELQARFTNVKHHTDNANILSIEFDNIATTTGHHFWSCHEGGFGNVDFWNIPLDELINLRDKLTAIIDKEIAKLNEEMAKPPKFQVVEPKTETFRFSYVADDEAKSIFMADIQATDLNEAVGKFKASGIKYLSYHIVNKEYQVS